MAPMSPGDDKCSFCGKRRDQVSKLAIGMAASICNDCLDLCGEIAATEFRDPSTAGRHPSLVCSFCERSNRQWLVAGPRVYICDECADGFRNSN
jgi:ATP-dependent protease Clp ATPase subunit